MVRRSAPASSMLVAKLCRLCLMQHRRHYAASRTMPQVDIAEAVHRLCSSGCAAYFVTQPGTLGE